MSKFLALSYYFSVRPDPNFQYTKLTALLVALLVLAGFAIQWGRRRIKDEVLKKMVKGLPTTLYIFSMILAVLLLCREGGIPLFSMRIWWILWVLSFAYWLVTTLIGFGKEYRERKAREERNASVSKYLPRKKR